jgi:hypothetical protein
MKPRASTRVFALAVGPAIAVAALHAAPRADGQTGPGWISLFDGKTNGLFAEGPFTLQHGDGVIKFRKVALEPL